MVLFAADKRRYDRKADSESLDCGVRGRPLGDAGGASSYTAVDGVMLGTTLRITADVQGARRRNSTPP